jgi:hypothetical protein
MAVENISDVSNEILAVKKNLRKNINYYKPSMVLLQEFASPGTRSFLVGRNTLREIPVPWIDQVRQSS